MRKIICAPLNMIPQNIDENIKYFAEYTTSKRPNVGYFATSLMRDLRRVGISPSAKVWDFTTIALSVAAADKAISRQKSPDGWTRQIDLVVHLHEPHIWDQQKKNIESTLRFLTGDFWNLTFNGGGSAPPRAKQVHCFDNDCVSLLSGGADSLIGAIDIVADGRAPIFVSQVVPGDASNQRLFAQRVCPLSPHLQWSHKIHVPQGESENSTRGRSIVFFAFAALAAEAIHQTSLAVPIFIPENGFISQNIPLNTGRIGSFSTKTTHPVYISGLQKVWDNLDFNVTLVMPYKFKTKGEMLIECKNQPLLNELIWGSVSCGKYRVYNRQHCGRCVPCMVRRAAFLHANMEDQTTKGYKYTSLQHAGLSHGPNDLGAMARACLFIEQYGIQRQVAGLLSYANITERAEYESVIQRGFAEITNFLNENDMI